MNPAFFKSFDNITSSVYVTDSDHFASFGLSTKDGGIRIRHAGGGFLVRFSFTGQEDHGVIIPGSVDLVFEGGRADRIYLRAGTGAETIEVYAWTGL